MKGRGNDKRGMGWRQGEIRVEDGRITIGKGEGRVN
jgi:hypothetical protein